MSEELNFADITPIELPVTIGEKKYVLREADEETAAIFSNARLKGVQLDDGKVTGLPEDLAGVQSLLVSRCLFPYNVDGKAANTPVPRDVVKSWPSRIVKPLFEKAKEISELDEGEETLEGLLKQQEDTKKKIDKMKEESAKNVLGVTMGGSV